MNVKHLNTIVPAAYMAASALLGGSPVAAQSVAAVMADARVAATDHTGAQALGLALRRMGTPRRVLMIGAHPDDENTAVLATLALGFGADVAYLSMTRGDGGQNLVGPELTEGLGLIRTDELLAARRIDGAQQFFSRAYDYGYSKSADEAFRHWPRDSLIADAVAVIRRFRPDVILSVWSGSTRDGHGQHQAAGIVAIEAFDAAADPARFPAQIRAGLRPHRTRHLLQSTWRPSGEPAFWLQTGELDPLFGRSHFQISMASRSLHRSQDQGSEQPPGPQQTAIIPLGSAALARPPGSLFEGVAATLAEIAADAPPALTAALSAYQASVEQATMSFNPLQPNALVPHLTAALDALDRAVPLAADPDLRFRIDAERAETGEALRLAAGLILDATADDPIVVPGQAFIVTLRLWNGGSGRITVDRLAPELPAGWTVEPLDGAVVAVEPGAMAERRFRVTVALDPEFSGPYFLEKSRAGDLYVWPDDAALRGLPYGPAPVGAITEIGLGQRSLAIRSETAFIDVDKAMGERRLPVLVVPAIGVAVEPAVAVLPLGEPTAEHGDDGSPPRRVSSQVSVTLAAEAAGGLAGVLRLEPPAGWTVEPASISVRFDGPGERRAISFTVLPPPGLKPGMYRVGAVFEAEDGRSYRRGWSRIDYPHTQPRLLFRDGATTFSAFPVAIAAGLRVGVIEGAGDDAGAALARMGATVESIGPDALRNGDLGRYDAIISGIRAYEVRQDLIEANGRILDWVSNGGTFIVQYNKHEFVRGGFAPYPLTIAQSADRVTDEESPVRFLVPDHPALNTPNRIGPADFEGWVQERGLYFPNGWDDHYTPLLELNDPDEPAQQGSLLVTNHGSGTYVYVTLSFFRQLPEGVPGAYRLLANLVSLGGS